MNLKKLVPTFIAGVLATVAGYFLGKKHGTDESKEVIDNLCKEIDELTAKPYRQKSEDPAKPITDKQLAEEFAADMNAIPRKAVTSQQRKGDYQNLQEMAKKYRDPDLMQHVADRTGPSDDEPEEEEMPIDLNGYVPEPIEISKETYDGLTDPPQSYISIDYYPMDDVLVDDMANVLEEEDMIAFLGQALRDTIRDREDDVILVLNHPLDALYEITMQKGASYYSMDDTDYLTAEQEEALEPEVEEEDEDEDDDQYFDPRYPGKKKF